MKVIFDILLIQFTCVFWDEIKLHRKIMKPILSSRLEVKQFFVDSHVEMHVTTSAAISYLFSPPMTFISL